MKTITKIMVAVDFSDYSLAAADYAAKLAKDTGAALLFTNVFNQRDVSLMNKAGKRFLEFSAEKNLEAHMNDRKERLNDLAKRITDNDMDVKTNLRIGVPYLSLLDEIKSESPDLLVMGAKGRSSVVDMIIGSCAQKMFRHSPIPLLSIRGH